MISWILLVVGMWLVLGALFEWGVLMESRKGQLWTGLVGRQGARLFFGVLGSAIIVVAVLIGRGVIFGG